MRNAVCQTPPTLNPDHHLEELVSTFHNHNCNIPETTGYAISQVHHTFQSDGHPVEVPGGFKHISILHCLRHVETGFVENFSTNSADLFRIIDEKLEPGKLLCCDEHYTTFELVNGYTSRNILFLGRISNTSLSSAPQMMKRSETQSFRVFCENFWLWICWDDPVNEPIVLVSNFHMGQITDWTNCDILSLYNKSIYGSEKFDRFSNIYKYNKNHPMCLDSMNTVIYQILNAMIVNSKILYEQQSNSQPTSLLIHFVKILLSYGCIPYHFVSNILLVDHAVGDKSNNDYSNTVDRNSGRDDNDKNADDHNTAITEISNQAQINDSSTAVSLLHKGQEPLSINIVEDNPGMFFQIN